VTIAPPILPALRQLPPERASAEAARQLETVFLTQLLQAMRRTVPESDLLPRSPERETYEGVFDGAVAEALAERDPLGLVGAVAGRLKSEPRSTDSQGGGPEDRAR